MGDILTYLFIQVFLNTICYGTGAVTVMIITGGSVKPGMVNGQVEVVGSNQISEFTYSTEGGRYLHRK